MLVKQLKNIHFSKVNAFFKILRTILLELITHDNSIRFACKDD
jgi:hypothetical protein